MSDRTGSERNRSTEPSHEPFKLDLAKFRDVAPKDLAIRFGFGFAVSVMAGIIVNTTGPVFGGMFLAFPAVLPATTTLLQRRAGLAQASADVRGATVGALAMIGFAFVAWRLLRSHHAAIALPASLATWLVLSAVIFAPVRAIVRVLGENKYLPEIPTREAAALLDVLRSRSLTVATAESCTGGLVAAFLTSVPGASDVFRGSVIAYTDTVKHTQLNVDAVLLQREGAVSAGVAAEMSRNIRTAIGADIGVALTGNTGDPSEGKPSGLTFIAVTGADKRTWIRRYTDDFGPGRNDERAIRMAFQLVTDTLTGDTSDDHNVDENTCD